MKKRGRVGGGILIAVGAILISAPLAYLGFARWSVSQSDRYEYLVPARERDSWFAVTPGNSLSTAPASRSAPPTVAPQSRPTLESAAAAVEAAATPSQTPTATGGQTFNVLALYPAQFINPKYWAAPLFAGSDAFGGPGLPDGFERVTAPGQGLQPGTSGSAIRIVIPAIDVDSVVRRLEPVRRGDGLAYGPVDKFVGQVPGTANPGEIGTGWYFGHLESPGLGEGNVFHRFPELPRLIQQDPVDVHLYTESAVFVYRVVETAIIAAEDLALSDSRDSRIALVASFPSRVYTHRLVVYAELYARRVVAGG